MPIRGNNDLQTVARARALCMAVRLKTWKPRPGNVLSDVLVVKPNQRPAAKTRLGKTSEFRWSLEVRTHWPSNLEYP